MGALKAAYPQDHYSDSGENLKMHPAMGVTLKLNRNDGTLKIKGKKHMDWFKENFEQVSTRIIAKTLCLSHCILFLKFWRTLIIFVGPLIRLLLESSDVCL